MFKALGRIGKDRIKFMVDFSASTITLTSAEDFCLLVQVARGDRDPVDLPLIKV